ncbi:MAG: aldolase [Bryobacterales bacterium]|nr:aldolase [Bryobacterales bacterium]
MSASPRMHRLFAQDGRCLVIALDHGIFHETSFVTGMEDIAHAVGQIVKTAPDAMQLAPGQARILQSIPGPRKPALVLRADTTNVYTRPAANVLFSVLMEQAAEQAVALDAAAVVVNLLSVPGHEELHEACLRHIAHLRTQCDRYGMPLMVEPLVMLQAPNGRTMESSLNAQAIAMLTRQAVEMGADLIKADASEDVAEFGRVVEAASGKPVLVRGGATMNADLLLARTASLLQKGAQGLVFGRNILQANQPDQLVAALLSLLHGNGSAEQTQNSVHRPAAGPPPPLPPPVPAVPNPT